MTALAVLAVTLAAATPAVSAQESFAPEPRIIGGDEVPVGAFPFMAYMVVGPYQCGGSLVDIEWVMTAAHCVEDLTIDDVTMVIGRRDLTNIGTGEVRDAREIVIHPAWISNGFRNDIAFVRIDPVTTIDPIKIADASQAALWSPGTMATVAGWGETQTPIGAPDVLYSVDVPVLSDLSCLASVPGPDVVPAIMVCAGDTQLDSCQGDSGGPLFVPDPQGGYIAFGITSWGLGCGDVNSPGVYTEVTAFDPFISSIFEPLLVTYTVTCLNGNGVVTVSLDNPTSDPIATTITMGSLAPRPVIAEPDQLTVERFSGRPDGIITATVDAGYIIEDDVVVTCDPPISLTQACIADNGAVFIDLTNQTAATATYSVQLGNLSPRTLTLDSAESGRISITGRRDGVLPLTISVDGAIVTNESIRVDCDPDIEVVAESGCLGENGLVSVTVTNVTDTDATYSIAVGSLAPRMRMISTGDTTLVRVSGRPDGDLAVVVERDGSVVDTSTVTVACDPVSTIEAAVAHSCLAGRGRVDVSLANLNAFDAAYQVTVGALSPRVLTLLAGASDVISVTGRPDGPLPVTVTRDGIEILSEIVDIAC